MRTFFYMRFTNFAQRLNFIRAYVILININMKSKYILGCTGHINLSRIEKFDIKSVREKICAYFEALKKNYTVELYSGFAYGADSLFAEAAIDCGLKVYAVLPCPQEEFAAEQPDGGELFKKLIVHAEGIIYAENSVERYVGVSEYVLSNCNELLAIWDGKKLPLTDVDGKPVNRGGTYHTILLAQKSGKPVRFYN